MLIEPNPQGETIAQDCETIVVAHRRRVAKKTNEKEPKVLMAVAVQEAVRTLIALLKRFISLTVMQMTRETAPSHRNDMCAKMLHAHDPLLEDPVLFKSMIGLLESTLIPAHKPNSPKIQVIIWR